MILRGRPIPVEFMGFHSDTYQLQRAGWQIAESVDRDACSGGTFGRLAIRHPRWDVYGVSEPFSRKLLLPVEYPYSRHIREEPFTITIHLAREIRMALLEPLTVFIAVDTTPYYAEREFLDEFLLSETTFFRPIEEGEEILLHKASIDEILYMALQKQEPEQARIRMERQAEAKREEYRRSGKVAAKLIAI